MNKVLSVQRHSTKEGAIRFDCLIRDLCCEDSQIRDCYLNKLELIRQNVVEINLDASVAVQEIFGDISGVSFEDYENLLTKIEKVLVFLDNVEYANRHIKSHHWHNLHVHKKKFVYYLVQHEWLRNADFIGVGQQVWEHHRNSPFTLRYWNALWERIKGHGIRIVE